MNIQVPDVRRHEEAARAIPVARGAATSNLRPVSPGPSLIWGDGFGSVAKRQYEEM